MSFLVPVARPDPSLLGRFGRLVYWVMLAIAGMIVAIFGIGLLVALASPQAQAANLDPVFEEAGREWNVDPDLLRAIAVANSSPEGAAVYNKGGIGLMHITPKMAAALGATNPLDDTQSIFAAAKLMNYRLELSKGNVTLALEMYEGGANLSKLGPKNASYPAFVMSRYVNTRGTPATAPAVAPPHASNGAVVVGLPPGRAEAMVEMEKAAGQRAVVPQRAATAEPDYSDFLRRTGAMVPGTEARSDKGLVDRLIAGAAPAPLEYSKVSAALMQFVSALLVASLIALFGRGARYLFAGE